MTDFISDNMTILRLECYQDTRRWFKILIITLQSLNSMVFLACGLNHKTAPIEIREKVALANEDTSRSFLRQFLAHPQIHEATVLSTCNRTEVYCDTQDTDIISQCLADIHGLPSQELAQHLYQFEDSAGISHAMRVAAGLDSMMLGEPQILGQMKKAFKLAESVGSIGQQLRPIFHHVFSASKRIRSHTGIGVNPVSVSYAAYQLIKRLYPSLAHASVLVIGSGETAKLLLNYLQSEGIENFYISSRTPENAAKLASKVNGTSLAINEIPLHLAKADIVITATACPFPFITKTLVEKSLVERNQKPMFLLDLSVPRDIEDEVNALDNVMLYNIDNIQTIVDEGLNERQQAVQHAEQIIAGEIEAYIRWHRTLKAKQIICQYREHANSVGDDEVARALKFLEQGDNSFEDVLNELKRRLVNKLAHRPTVGLKRAASDNQEDLLSLSAYLFDE